MTKQPFKLEGGRALLDTLADLPKATQQGVLRRVMNKAIEPIAANVKAKAPKLYGDLEKSLITGGKNKLNKRQRSLNRESRNETQVHFGTSDPAGIANEFGREGQAANPFFRSEWESGKDGARRTIERELGGEIVKTATRRAKRMAKGK